MTRAALFLLSTLLVAGCQTAPAPTSSSPTQTRQPGSGQTEIGASRESNRDSESRNSESQGRSSERSRRSRRARPSANAQPGVFDFYLLTLSWSPEFCATHVGSPECPAHPGFVVHGLWPQNNDGTYPEDCSSAPGPANPGQYTNLLPTASLVEHEWSTHGTCSGLAPDAYFGEIGTAFHALHIPADFSGAHQPASLTPSAIISDFTSANPGLPPGSVAISCGKNYLTAVEVCLSKTLQPEACQSVHTCGATVVKITSR